MEVWPVTWGILTEHEGIKFSDILSKMFYRLLQHLRCRGFFRGKWEFNLFYLSKVLLSDRMCCSRNESQHEGYINVLSVLGPNEMEINNWSVQSSKKITNRIICLSSCVLMMNFVIQESESRACFSVTITQRHTHIQRRAAPDLSWGLTNSKIGRRVRL